MPSATTGPIRSEALWFSDGNIVITSKYKTFRVHRTQLVKISPFFQQQFHTLTPSMGCHSIHLDCDSEDLEYFLKSIFIPDYFAQNIKLSSKQIDFTLLSAVLRASTKFDVAHLRRQSIAHLTSICPTSLQELDMRHENFGPTNIPKIMLPEMIIKLAKETNVKAVLPFAFYRYASQPLQYILDGDLDWEDKKACLVARQEFSRLLRSTIFGFLLGRTGDDHMSECQSRNRCAQEKLAFLNMKEDSLSSGSKGPLDYNIDWADVGRRFCQPCTIAFKISFELGRIEFWDELPRFFGLPDDCHESEC